MEIIERIRSYGMAEVHGLSLREVDETLAFLKSRQVFVGRHVVQGDVSGFMSWDAAAGANVLCWTLSDAILAPHLLETALQFFDVAGDYLQADPLLYSMNVFCTRPGQAVRPDIQDWHRDTDDVRFLPMFFYLTDVKIGDGHQELRVGDGSEVQISGHAGTVFFSDTSREHRGLKPISGERIIAWARWGISDPPASYVWDKLEPIDKHLLGNRWPIDERLRRALRLIAR